MTFDLENYYNKADDFCKTTLKVSLKTILIAVLVIVVLITVVVLICHLMKKTPTTEKYTVTENAKKLKDTLQEYISSWNTSVKNFYGVSEGFKVTKSKKPIKTENYERSRGSNDFKYLKKED